jgi:hypothetical protein
MFDSLQQFWERLNSAPEARMVFWLTVLAIVIFVSIYIIKTIRDWMIGGVGSDSDHLSTFRELRDQGKLDDEEYKRLKIAINPKLTNAGTIEFKEVPSTANSDGDD